MSTCFLLEILLHHEIILSKCHSYYFFSMYKQNVIDRMISSRNMLNKNYRTKNLLFYWKKYLLYLSAYFLTYLMLTFNVYVFKLFVCSTGYLFQGVWKFLLICEIIVHDFERYKQIFPAQPINELISLYVFFRETYNGFN